MSELIMTISDDDEEPVMPSAEPPATTAEAAGDVDGAVLAAVAEEGTRGAQGAHPESEDEDAGFSRGFTFSDSGSDSEEEELIHAWDLGEAKQASRVATTGASTLSDKIAATLRRKGTPDDSSSAAASKKRKAGAAEGDEESAGRDERATAVEQEREQQEQDEGEEEQQAGEREEQDEQVAKKPKSRRKRAAGAAGAAGQGASSSQHSWDELQLSRPLLRALKELGFASPTPIQAATVPAALGGRDVCGSAVTGSGKTAAFMLPVLERLIYRPRRVAATRVLVVTPTRELAIQIHAMTGSLGRHTDVRAAMAVGGLSLQVQEAALRTKPDVVVGTPGRLIDLCRNSLSISMEELEILILDEADRLLDLGFADELTELVKLCPRGRQTLLFSATMGNDVERLTKLSLNNPLIIRADSHFSTASGLRQQFVRLKKGADNDRAREAVLLSLAARSLKVQTIVFFRSKKQAHRLSILFGLMGLRAAELHGNLTQLQRLEALEQFRDGATDFLLATDLASRGLDILGVQHVINFDLPSEHEAYVHRVGRTARAGRQGLAVSLVGERERALLKTVAKHAGKAGLQARAVPAAVVAHFLHKVRAIEADVADILKQERTEKELRVAEMEANKASNLLAHRQAIAGRPARSWFQTEVQKRTVKNNWRDQREALDIGVREEGARTRKKKTRGEAKAAKRSEEKGKQSEERRAQEQHEMALNRSGKAAVKRGLLPSGKPRDSERQRQKPKKTAFDRELGRPGGANTASNNSGREQAKGSFKSKKRYKRR